MARPKTKTKGQAQLEYNHRHKLKLGRLILDYLREHPCVDCETEDIRVLEFDHRTDRGPKIAGISELVNASRPWAAIRHELEKCDVRCRNCHVIRTHEVSNSWRHQLWVELAQAGQLR